MTRCALSLLPGLRRVALISVRDPADRTLAAGLIDEPMRVMPGADERPEQIAGAHAARVDFDPRDRETMRNRPHEPTANRLSQLVKGERNHGDVATGARKGGRRRRNE